MNKIKDRKIRFSIIGCGRISRNHIKSILLHHENAELIAICDNQEERIENAKNLISQLNTENSEKTKDPIVFFEYKELLKAIINKELKIDIIVLATPSGLHAEQAIEAANAGLHVCTEKPMATNYKDGLLMNKACKENRVHLFVVKQNRFNRTLQLVKKQIEKERFGKIALVTINVFWHRPQSYYDLDSWRGTLNLDGGALMNQASHYVDLLDWLIGPLQSISASIATIGRSIEAEDTAALQMRWKNGALGTMAVTMLTYPKNLEGSITILGEKGTVKIGGPAVNKIEKWEFSDETEDDDLVESASYETTNVYGFGHPPYYENLINVLKGISSPACSGDDGLRSLEILTGAYKSAEDNLVITFPLK
ncbi:oxidoreductase [bacterium]|nr:oxidoreductase [bacterium]|tara:strand:- start:5249 stop:6346 length:1098 start_codon:yes stop_codon:yes gene_type:complete